MDPHRRTKILVAIVALASSVWAQNPDHGSTTITPVTGESWLNHLHRSFDETSMGKTGRLGPSAEESQAGTLQLVRAEESSRAPLHGSDLYRWNCRGCHGESGLGAPPEINSVINPVRSSSALLIMERMKKVGMAMSPADAATLAQQSHSALLERLHKGGQDMPSFPHLSDLEIRSLMAYLRELAEVPHAASQQVAIDETPVRIGEHIVKSTCHVCHSASGPNPTPQQLAEGAIPPLSTLTIRVNQAGFVQKVTRGAPIVMGTPPLACRGRMPVFYYLSADEAADAYLYLVRYPPGVRPAPEPVMTLAMLEVTPLPPASPPPNAKASLVTHSTVARDERTLDMESLAFMAVVGVLVSVLLAGVFGFTVWECMRIAAHHRTQVIAAQKAAQVTSPVGGHGEQRLIA